MAKKKVTSQQKYYRTELETLLSSVEKGGVVLTLPLVSRARMLMDEAFDAEDPEYDKQADRLAGLMKK